jgi:hypothetical protein
LPSPHETAYPTLKNSFTQNELAKYFTPSEVEIDMAFASVSGKASRLCFLVLLKTFQRLGYFVMIDDVPERVKRHVAHCLKIPKVPDISDYDVSGTRQRHLTLIREYLQVRPFDEDARKALLEATKEAALTRKTLQIS